VDSWGGAVDKCARGDEDQQGDGVCAEVGDEKEKDGTPGPATLGREEVIRNCERPRDENEQPEIHRPGGPANHDAVLRDEVREEKTRAQPCKRLEGSGRLSVGKRIEGPDEGDEQEKTPDRAPSPEGKGRSPRGRWWRAHDENGATSAS